MPGALLSPNCATRLARLLCLGALLASAGCAESLPTRYGRRGSAGGESVNGTSVFAAMVKQRGHRVSSWHLLSPKLQKKADVIVWFSEQFDPPPQDAQQWLNTWLRARRGRVLVYVGRDFDAAPLYWRQMQEDPPAKQVAELQRLRTAAESHYGSQRLATKSSDDGEWFTPSPPGPPQRIAALDGEPEWTTGIDASAAEIVLGTSYAPSESADVVLTGDGEVLVTREAVWGGERWIVANGSFLLNLPLVNHEHRKLASRLIDELGPAPREVYFLETGPGGPQIRQKDPQADAMGLQLFGLWPFNYLLLHLAIVAVVYGFWRAPIFGTPREPAPAPLGDFGQHIDAVGQLLERSGDRGYATLRLQQYRQATTGEKPTPAAESNATADATPTASGG